MHAILQAQSMTAYFLEERAAIDRACRMGRSTIDNRRIRMR